MSKISIFSLAALLLAWAVSPALAQSDLSRFEGKNRLLLVFAPSRSDPRWQKQNALLAGSGAGFKERNLLRFDFLENQPARGASLRVHYGVKPGQFRVLLIGKDGHVASAVPSPISLRELTEQIDRMPMRRREMHRRGR